MSNALLDLQRPQPTGGLIVTFEEGCAARDGEGLLRDVVGAEVHAYGDAADGAPDLGGAWAAVYLVGMGIAFVSEAPGGPDVARIRARLAADARVAEVRPEFWLYTLETFADQATATWGVAATGAGESRFTGRGVKLAVLDTGIDAGHPDFAGREIVARSFVPGEAVADVQGHGTHCAGTAAGGSAGSLRYGVAPGAALHVGKVLGDGGMGRERDVQAGIVWAMQAGCAVISMSLGRVTQPGEQPSPDYERLGRRALEHGSLIVAAAGNESARAYGFIAPVGSPANTPSIMAVGAVDEALGVAEFSSGGIDAGGGEVDVAAPGVGVFSSVPRPRLYASLRGTSMACPHAAGVAALWAEAEPGLRGRALWERLVASARRLPAPPRDVGAGLVQAPGKAWLMRGEGLS